MAQQSDGQLSASAKTGWSRFTQNENLGQHSCRCFRPRQSAERLKGLRQPGRTASVPCACVPIAVKGQNRIHCPSVAKLSGSRAVIQSSPSRSTEFAGQPCVGRRDSAVCGILSRAGQSDSDHCVNNHLSIYESRSCNPGFNRDDWQTKGADTLVAGQLSRSGQY